MQLRSVMPILELEMEQFSWMMLAALAVRQISLTALEVLLSTVYMDMQKMLEYDVKVWKNGTVQLYLNDWYEYILYMCTQCII